MTATTVPTVTVPRVTLPTPTTLSGPRTPHEPHEAAPGARTGGGTWTDLIEKVQEAGRYPTREEAEHITRTVLTALGAHVIGDERVALARALPEEAAKTVASQIPATHPRTAPEFVDSIAARIEGATPAMARWDVSSVLSVLPDLVGDDLITRIIAQLPPGYALLFGRADLSRTP
ncbi:DUF2267 domain-containing protein [Streptomyces sp. NPDC001480]|uniref:DUF2267 domain-containing protein n=1 Tax=Streptomyces sp. NPDC001480 TaxID=3364577 RepID=UPI0036954627